MLFSFVFQGCGETSWQSKVKEQLPILDTTAFIFEYPDGYNHELIAEKGLGKSAKVLSDDYRLMQALYKKAFISYIADKLDLKRYDDELSNSGLNFVSHENDSYLGAKHYLGTKYIMILNRCYIEQLDKNDLEILRRTLEAGNAEVTDELADLVRRTWQDVIKIRDDEADNFYVMINKDPVYTFSNDAIVLGIGTVMYKDENGNVDMEKEDEKAEFLENYCARMMEEMDGKLGDVPIKVFSFIK